MERGRSFQASGTTMETSQLEHRSTARPATSTCFTRLPCAFAAKQNGHGKSAPLGGSVSQWCLKESIVRIGAERFCNSSTMRDRWEPEGGTVVTSTEKWLSSTAASVLAMSFLAVVTI